MYFKITFAFGHWFWSDDGGISWYSSTEREAI